MEMERTRLEKQALADINGTAACGSDSITEFPAILTAMLHRMGTEGTLR